MSKPRTTNPNAIVRPRMLASTRDRLHELSAELSEDSYEGQRLVIEMAERAAVHMRNCQIAESVSDTMSKENLTMKAKLESMKKCYTLELENGLKLNESISKIKEENRLLNSGCLALSAISIASILIHFL